MAFLLINQKDLSCYEHVLPSLCSCFPVTHNWVFLFTPSQLTAKAYQSPRNNRKTKLRSEMMELEIAEAIVKVCLTSMVYLTYYSDSYGSCCSNIFLLTRCEKSNVFSPLRSFKFKTPFLPYFLNFLLAQEDSVN